MLKKCYAIDYSQQRTNYLKEYILLPALPGGPLKVSFYSLINWKMKKILMNRKLCSDQFQSRNQVVLLSMEQ